MTSRVSSSWVLLALVASTVLAADAPRPFRDCASCPPMVVVPAGQFVMGAELAESRALGLPDYWAVREQPRHRVVVDTAFAIARYEITREQFAAFSRDANYEPASGCWHFIGSEWLFDEQRNWRDAKIGQADDHPVTCINWHDAAAYADWLSEKTGEAYRLVSEAEWEYAARAGTETAYWFGDDPAVICRFVNLGDLDTRDRFRWDKTEIKYDVMDDWKGQPCRDGHATTAPVTSTSPNPFGIHGLLGNANEWVADCYHENYADGPATQRARVTSGDCGLRVMRGQGWTGMAAGTRPAFRLKMNATDRRFTFGFRVARDL